MAKREISKHSRAARRSQADAPEAKELSKLPRVSGKSDMVNYIVRTTNKNEDLLQSKIAKKRGKKNSKKLLGERGVSKGLGNNAKFIRAVAFSSKLSAKIERSINNGLKMQKRRSTWDQVNDDLKNINNSGLPTNCKKQEKDDDEMEFDDESDDDFFEEKKEKAKPINSFACLDEEDA